MAAATGQDPFSWLQQPAGNSPPPGDVSTSPQVPHFQVARLGAGRNASCRRDGRAWSLTLTSYSEMIRAGYPKVS